MPDRLLSLGVLVGFWVPAMIVGRSAATFAYRRATRVRPVLMFVALAAFVLAWTAAWFFFNLSRMPPYIPGASRDPTYAPPEAVAGLAIVASALVLPGSALACALAFRSGLRSLRRTADAHASAQPD